jgi:hypothetical protein
MRASRTGAFIPRLIALRIGVAKSDGWYRRRDDLAAERSCVWPPAQAARVLASRNPPPVMRNFLLSMVLFLEPGSINR